MMTSVERAALDAVLERCKAELNMNWVEMTCYTMLGVFIFIPLGLLLSFFFALGIVFGL